MALLGRHFVILSALILLFATPSTKASEESEDGVTVETVGEDYYESPKISQKNLDNVYFAEHFDDVTNFKKRWVLSEAKKLDVDEVISKYDGKWKVQNPQRKILKDDLGLVLTTEAKHAAISALLDKPFHFKTKPLVVQYEVTLQEGQTCGGAYIKLLSESTNTKADLRKFYDQTPYTIMFGPDKCGNDNKLHFIFRHMNPIDGTYEEKHSKKPSERLEDVLKDKAPHLYTLIVRPDNTFSVYVDHKEFNSGSLLEDFAPPVNPSETIDDPDDVMPEDWDEKEKIVDPSATKPEDWDESAPAQIVEPNAVKPDGWLEDEPETIPDPNARKPEDWDEEMDGEWEPPLVDNPACATAPGCGPWAPPLVPNPEYKGIWRAPLIANPNYKGKWTPRRVRNPRYFRDDHPFRMTPIHAVGFELWSMSPLLLFDNVLITDSEEVASNWAQQTFDRKRVKIDNDAQTVWGRIVRATGNKPGWWALYVVYVAIPICAYIFYLLRFTTEDSFATKAVKYASDNPWVYALVVIVLLIFIGFILYICSSGNKDTDSEDAKKTDAYQEDDPHQSEGEGEGEAEAEAEVEGEEKVRGSKADLEGPEGDAPTTQTAPLPDADAAGDGQRKRKPRKE